MSYLNGFLNYVNNYPVAQAVKIMAILSAVGGFVMLMAGFGLFGLAALAVGVGFLSGGFAAFWGFICLVEGAAQLLFAYGAWFIKPWAQKLGVYIQYANIAIALINWLGGSTGFFSFLFSVLISGLIIYYLQRPQVKQYFGVV
jgi:hypothetical protein